MDKKLKADEVALLIRARKLLKEKGLPKDIDVSGICEAAGVSRKTGYEWESRLTKADELVLALEQENEELKKKHAELAALYLVKKTLRRRRKSPCRDICPWGAGRTPEIRLGASSQDKLPGGMGQAL